MKNILKVMLLTISPISSACVKQKDVFKIIIGSTNKGKIKALEETLKDYPSLADYTLHAVDVPSHVANQPLSLEETVQGAVNRAKNSFKDCDLSVGIESGLLAVPHTVSGYMCITACAIYDGHKYHIGLSSAFECPPNITTLMVEQGLDMNQAFYQAGLTDDQKIGSSVGAVSILTAGRIDRISRTKEAVVTALISVENAELFDRY